jgi:hypothetical protein
MGLLQDIADAVGTNRVQQLADEEGDFEEQGSPDQATLQELLKRVDPNQLQQILGQATRRIDPQEYSDHVTPGVNNTDPLGQLKGGGLAAIAGALLGQLKQAGASAAQQPQQIPGVQRTDPREMEADDVAAVARYTQKEHPEAFGKAAAEIGQQQPGLLNSFLGKAAMAAAAAALASHFIKMDRKAPK